MKKIIALSLTWLALTALIAQGDTENRKKVFNLGNGVGLQGYDPVAYFTTGKATQGSNKFTSSYQGVFYHFASQSNRQEFEKNPAKFEPQYGGWCAYAMGKDGSRVEVDPETFKIIDNKLYLYYNKYFNNTLKTWNKNESNLKKQADANWQKIYHP